MDHIQFQHGLQEETPTAVQPQESANSGMGLAKAAKILLWAFAFFLPIWLFPGSVNIQTGREVFLGSLILLSGMLWLLSALLNGKIHFRRSLLLPTGLVLVGLWTLSGARSPTMLFSALFTSVASEKLVLLAIGFFLMLATGGILVSRKDARNLLFTLLAGGGLAGIFSLLQFLFSVSIYKLFSATAGGIDFNVIGTVNGLAIFYAILLAMSAGLFLDLRKEDSPRLIYGLWALMAVFLLNLLLINFRFSWIALLGSSIVLGALFSKTLAARRREEMVAGPSVDPLAGGGNPLLSHGSIVIVVLIVLSTIMMFVQKPPLKDVGFPAEVTPSRLATWALVQDVYTEGTQSKLLGSGPGTFGYVWERYKDPMINQTPFWTARFDQGVSAFLTMMATTGIVGTIAWVLFMVSALVLFLKKMLSGRTENLYASSFFAGFVAILISALLYPGNLTFLWLLFLCLGALTVVLSGSPEENTDLEPTKTQRGLWGIRSATLHTSGSWAMFSASLVIILLLAIGAGTVYAEFGQLSGALHGTKAEALLGEGNLSEALVEANQAVSADGKNFQYHHQLARIRSEQIRQLITSAGNGQNVQKEFQAAVSQAVLDTQQAIALNPREPLTYRTQGQLYEMIVPYVDGAERFAFTSYQKAHELSPTNPTYLIDLGRAELIFADKTAQVFRQNPGDKGAELQKSFTQATQQAAIALNQAAQLKPDLAVIHFLLAQTAIRVGNLAAAVQGLENAQAAAPNDAGIAFQRGILYYQAHDLEKAGSAFARAIEITPTYSNARYFLGLILDAKGQKPQAIDQFIHIEALNQDNQEVKHILENLRSGKTALDGIVPPAPPPQNRTDLPVKENTANKAAATPKPAPKGK